MLKRYTHNPAHLYLDNTVYFITAAIYEKRWLIATHELKTILLEQIQSFFAKTDREYLIRQNYLFYNPAKHGYVTKLQDYPYSSFHETFEKLGRDRLAEQFKEYPEYKTLQLTEAENDDF